MVWATISLPVPLSPARSMEAELDGTNRIVDLADPGNHQGGDIETAFFHCGEQIEAVAARHAQVTEKDVRLEALKETERLIAVFSERYVVVPGGEGLAPIILRGDIVVRDENF